MDDDSAENRWRKAANARWERFKKTQASGDKKARALATANKRGAAAPAAPYPGVKRDARIRKPVVLPQQGGFAPQPPKPRKQGGDEDNPWRRAANARWEKHRLQSGAGTPAPQRAPRAPAKPRAARKADDAEADGGLAAVFDDETMGLEGEELETFKKMCDSVLAKTNRLSGDSRRLIKEFLAGQYDEEMVSVENIILNDEIVPHPDEPGKYCRETLTFEMDYRKGKWRKLKRRWKRAILQQELQDAGIPYTDADADAKAEDDGAGADGAAGDEDMNGEGAGADGDAGEQGFAGDDSAAGDGENEMDS